MKNNFILYLEPYVYVKKNNKQKSFLLFNTIDGSTISRNMKRKIFDIVESLSSSKNLYVVSLNMNLLESDEIKEFLAEIRNKFMGDYYRCSDMVYKPTQTIPILKNKLPAEIIDEFSPFDHLFEINIYLNQSVSCKKNDYEIYKQHRWVKYGLSYSELCYKNLKKIMLEFKGTDVRINFIGGNIFNYSKFDELEEEIIASRMKASYYVHIDSIQSTAKIRSNIYMNILIDSYKNRKQFDKLFKIVDQKNLCYNFLVKSEYDLTKVYNIIDNYQISKYSILPYFNGSNIEFFINNVYTNDLNHEELNNTMRVINAKKLVNLNNYGSLTVLPNGKVFANVNHPSLGSLYCNDIIELSNKEILNGRSWKKNRGQVKPCKYCLLSELCPSITNVEYVLNKYDLCSLKNAENTICTKSTL